MKLNEFCLARSYYLSKAKRERDSLALSILRLNAFKVQEIINLIRYTYLDSLTLDLETNINRLRKLISLYIATNIKIISEYTSFMELIKGRSAFIRDL